MRNGNIPQSRGDFLLMFCVRTTVPAPPEPPGVFFYTSSVFSCSKSRLKIRKQKSKSDFCHICAAHLIKHHTDVDKSVLESISSHFGQNPTFILDS